MTPPKPPALISPARRAVLATLLRPASGSSFGFDPEAVADPFMNLEGRERAFAARLYRGVLQNLRLLDFMIDRAARMERLKTDPAVIWVLRMAVYQHCFLGGVPEYALVQQAVEQAFEIGGEPSARFLNAILRRGLPVLPSGPEQLVNHQIMYPPPPEGVRYSIPSDIAELYVEGYGAASGGKVLRSMNETLSRVWLRVNTLKTTAAELLPRLAEEGLNAEVAPEADDFLVWVRDVESTLTPWRTQAWADGLLTIQDLGAALAVKMLAPKPGSRVLDYCAAPGGKTGQLWESMKASGKLVALEVNPERRRPLEENLRRLYAMGHEIQIVDDVAGPVLMNPETGEPELFDTVLVDAPCLALGLARRHPEVRWDRRSGRMAQIQETQRGILRAAAKHVAPGGRIAWITCSPTREENEVIIADILNERIGLRALNPQSCLPESAEGWSQVNGTTVRTRPDLASVDGFAITILDRKK